MSTAHNQSPQFSNPRPRLQFATLLVLMAVTTARPGDFSISEGYGDRPYCVTWKDVEFILLGLLKPGEKSTLTIRDEKREIPVLRSIVHEDGFRSLLSTFRMSHETMRSCPICEVTVPARDFPDRLIEEHQLNLAGLDRNHRPKKTGGDATKLKKEGSRHKALLDNYLAFLANQASAQPLNPPKRRGSR
ncbi:hypothetical protein sr17603 [Sporisorium reilianum SRZ2]|uniref:Uncharacterized protein n=1 Tax=Sporisorium reilianum (strain SRZ2) TaxID=999809 RepID=E7A0J9_SPORE|nr:hypothetical protein sr17603 [Sporisorium reilianum SRZ2]